MPSADGVTVISKSVELDPTKSEMTPLPTVTSSTVKPETLSENWINTSKAPDTGPVEVELIDTDGVVPS